MCRLWPWRTNTANITDVCMNGGLALVIGATAVLMPSSARYNTKRSMDTVSAFLTFACSLIGGSFVGGCLWSTYRRLIPAKYWNMYISHHKGAAQALARYTKIRMTPYVNRARNCMCCFPQDRIFLDVD